MHMMDLEKSRFTKNLVRLNGLDFRRWLFEGGMLFGSDTKWWGDSGSRGRRHNGLDLRIYENSRGEAGTLAGGDSIPMMYEGRIVRVIRDFLGFSIFSAHGVYKDDRELLTIYGHVRPVADLSFENTVSEGTVIATLAEGSVEVPPHLHISVALVPKTIPPPALAWDLLDERDDVVFIDPGKVIEK